MKTWQHSLIHSKHRAHSRDGKISTVYLLVTVEIAKSMLALNTMNRAERRHHIENLTRDMSTGHWLLTHQGLAFMGEFEALLDGQNRLEAIVQSGVAQEMPVSWGFPLMSRNAMDRGIIRTIPDLLSLAQIFPQYTPAQLKVMVPVVKRVVNGMRYAKPSFTVSEAEAALRPHLQAFDQMFILMAGSHSNRHRGLNNAPVLAAIIRASYHVRTEVLARFCQVLLGAPPESAVEDIVRLHREWLLVNSKGRNSNWQAKIYARTAWVIAALAKGRPVKHLREPKEEPFPLESDAKLGGKKVYSRPPRAASVMPRQVTLIS